MKHTFLIRGMHCPSCVAKVSTALEGLDGVDSVRVTLQPPRANVEMKRHVPLHDLNQAVAGVGAYSLGEMAEEDATHGTVEPAESHEQPESLYPLFLIVGYLIGAVLLVALATGHGSLNALMRHFMGGFFLVFSFFKLLDLRGFASAYRSYDIVAKAFPAWGLAYPFVELGLGAAYLADWSPVVTNLITLVVMSVGSIGVLRALLTRQAIRCACLGTVLKLPMTKVTLVEDLGMAVMALATLILPV